MLAGRRWKEFLIHEAIVAQHLLAESMSDGVTEAGTVRDESVELAALAAGVYIYRQFREHVVREARAGESRRQLGRVHADQIRHEAVVDKSPGERGRIQTPERKDRGPCRSVKKSNAVIAHILQKE